MTNSTITTSDIATTTKRSSTIQSTPLPSSSKRQKLTSSTSNSTSTNPLEIKPLGNLYLNPSKQIERINGLGYLSILTDEFLLSEIFSKFSGEDLLNLGNVSKLLFSWSCLEGLWKSIYILRSNGHLLNWYSNWRTSYIKNFLLPSSISPLLPLPSASITTPNTYSDVLYQPILCSSFDPTSFLFNGSKSGAKNFKGNIKRTDGRGLKPQDLNLEEPLILTNVMDGWKALDCNSYREWTLEKLTKRFSNPLSSSSGEKNKKKEVYFRAEATLTTLNQYTSYHNNSTQDESPLYLFESEFVEKTIPLPSSSTSTEEQEEEEEEKGLGEDYEVPECFREDLFSLMGDQRPDYRWLIAGPSRSGSTFHSDPNSTSAWNALLSGSKYWLLFPPSITPPGIRISEDGGEVECPLSLAEWFRGYYRGAKEVWGEGVKGKEGGMMREGICRRGECFYVPSGWWHIVINLQPSIAVTQNFVSRKELSSVLKFMKFKPDQVSGFKLSSTSCGTEGEGGEGGVESGLNQKGDDLIPDIFEKFVKVLLESQSSSLQPSFDSEGEVVERKLNCVEEALLSLEPTSTSTSTPDLDSELKNKEKKLNKISSLFSKSDLPLEEGAEEGEGGGGFSFGFMEGDEEELDEEVI